MNKKNVIKVLRYSLMLLLLGTNLLGFEVSSRKIELDLKNDYFGEIEIYNTSNLSLNLLIYKDGETKEKIRDIKEEIELESDYLSLEPNSSKKLKFKYNSLKNTNWYSEYKAKIILQEIPNKLKPEKVTHNQIEIEIIAK